METQRHRGRSHGVGETLKPSLVEWKHSACRCQKRNAQVLETFLSGMETGLQTLHGRCPSCLETFLSGMETRQQAKGFRRRPDP